MAYVETVIAGTLGASQPSGIGQRRLTTGTGPHPLLRPHRSPGKPAPHAVLPQQQPPVAWRSGPAAPRGSGVQLLHPSTLSCTPSWASSPLPQALS